MKRKIAIESEEDPLDREIDFSDAQPNPLARDFHKFRNIRILAHDLLDAFPDSQSVNDALRNLLAKKPAKLSARRVTSPKSKPRTRKVRP